MANFPLREPASHEKCPNPDCKFDNISGAQVCEKCQTALTGGR
jgi:hypothetical protein